MGPPLPQGTSLGHVFQSALPTTVSMEIPVQVSDVLEIWRPRRKE